MLKPQQEIVRYFSEKHRLNFDTKTFSIQINVARNLLKQYDYEDVMALIEYTSIYPKKRITSLAYYKYIIDETMPKAKAYRMKKEEKVVYEEEKEVVGMTNKSLSHKKMFKRGNF